MGWDKIREKLRDGKVLNVSITQVISSESKIISSFWRDLVYSTSICSLPEKTNVKNCLAEGFSECFCISLTSFEAEIFGFKSVDLLQNPQITHVNYGILHCKNVHRTHTEGKILLLFGWINVQTEWIFFMIFVLLKTPLQVNCIWHKLKIHKMCSQKNCCITIFSLDMKIICVL